MASPSPSSSSLSDPGPSRKRPRSDLSSDERKEARAHRNRIAAQNSRDRRKAQFAFLEHRVNELEEENRQLRISLSLLSQGQQPPPVPDIENAELKEHIRTLGRGWDAFVKALAAQGFPIGCAPPATLPSPAPSHTSLDSLPSAPSTPLTLPTFVPTSSTSPSPLSTPAIALSPVLSSIQQERQEQDTTRHPARVASILVMALQRVVLPRRRLRSPSMTPWRLGLRNLRLMRTKTRWKNFSVKSLSQFPLRLRQS